MPSLRIGHENECSGRIPSMYAGDDAPTCPRISPSKNCNNLFHGSFTEIAFRVYSTVLSGLDTGAAEAPCPAETQTILIRIVAGIPGYSPFRSPIVRVLVDSDQRIGMTERAPF